MREVVANANYSIKRFLSNYTEVEVTLSTEFCYQFNKNTIYWTFLTVERQDRTFNDFIENTLHCPVCNSFIYGIFHELGHKMTADKFSDLDWEMYELDVSHIAEDLDGEEKDYAYYTLPVERAASQWAVDFIKGHINEIKLWFDNEFSPALDKVLHDDEVAALISELVEEENYDV